MISLESQLHVHNYSEQNNLGLSMPILFRPNQSNAAMIVTSLANEVMFSVAFVCLFVCKQH